MGLNEFAGYVAVAASALATGWIAARYGLRPQPFYLGVVFVAAGLALSALAVRETKHHVAEESRLQGASADANQPTPREIFWRTTLLDRNLSSVCQAGLVNNLNDGMAWGLFPLVFAAKHMTLEQIAVLAAVYPATWGIAQLVTGAWSDRVGRKWLIVTGMWVQAASIGIVVVATRFRGFALGGVLLGIGTAMVYPTLLAAIGDVAQPSWRASSVGVYRLWRDLGYAIGALLAGITADALGLPAAMWLVAALLFRGGRPPRGPEDEEGGARGGARTGGGSEGFPGGGPVPLAVRKAVDGRKQQQRQRGRCHETADDDRCKRALHLAAGRMGERHGDEAQRRDQRGHEHGAQPQLRRFGDRLSRRTPANLQVKAERNEHEAVQDRNAEERDEANARRDAERNVAKPESQNASHRGKRHVREHQERGFHLSERKPQQEHDQDQREWHDDSQACARGA